MSKKLELVSGNIICASFNADSTKLALCANVNVLDIYAFNGTSWELETSLKDHDLVITGVDWDPNYNRIVTCSEDRNAYVYEDRDGDGNWKPTLVLLRINRSAMAVKWSPAGNKFAVASGNRNVCVCYYDEEGDWWPSVHYKGGIKSTVLSIAWGPDNKTLAVGTSAHRFFLFDTYLDESGDPDLIGAGQTNMDPIYASTLGGWVHGIAFSPDGNWIAAAMHNSRVAFISQGDTQMIPVKDLPYKTCAFISDTCLIAAGWGYNPAVFVLEGSEWRYVDKIDKQTTRAAPKKSSMNKAASFWKDRVSRAEEGSAGKASFATQHMNTISEIIPLPQFVVTLGMDGFMVTWPYDVISKAIGVSISP